MIDPAVDNAERDEDMLSVKDILVRDLMTRNNLKTVFLDEPDPLVSIIFTSEISCRNAAKFACSLAAYQRMSEISFEILFVYCAEERICREYRNEVIGLSYLRSERGHQAGRNAAAFRSRGRYILFTDTSFEVLPGFLERLVEALAFPNAGISGPKVVFPDMHIKSAGGLLRNDSTIVHSYLAGESNPFAPEANFTREAVNIPENLFMIDKALFIEIGGFDESFSRVEFANADINVRSIQNGRCVVYEPRSVAVYHGSPSSASHDLRLEHEDCKSHFIGKHGRWLFGGNVELSCFSEREFDCQTLRVLFVEDSIPHIDSGGGMPRANFIVRSMEKLGYRVTIYPVYKADKSLSQRYRDIPPSVELLDANGAPGLKKLLVERSGYYDLVWVCRPHNIDLICQLMFDQVAQLHQHVAERVIFDCEALFCMRDFLVKMKDDGYVTSQTFADMIEWETRNYNQADCVVAVSHSEKNILSRSGVDNVAVLGHAFEVESSDLPLFADRYGFIFIGSLESPDSPNTDSLEWFLRDVWPLVVEMIPDARLFVVGSISPIVRQRVNQVGVVVLGRVEDPSSIFNQVRVNVAPTRYAAGIPHKVHEAMSRGVPSLITPILAGQIDWPKDVGYQICDWREPDDFASVLITMHSDENLWNDLQRSGMEKLSSECAPCQYVLALREICEA